MPPQRLQDAPPLLPEDADRITKSAEEPIWDAAPLAPVQPSTQHRSFSPTYVTAQERRDAAAMLSGINAEIANIAKRLKVAEQRRDGLTTR